MGGRVSADFYQNAERQINAFSLVSVLMTDRY